MKTAQVYLFTPFLDGIAVLLQVRSTGSEGQKALVNFYLSSFPLLQVKGESSMADKCKSVSKLKLKIKLVLTYL